MIDEEQHMAALLLLRLAAASGDELLVSETQLVIAGRCGAPFIQVTQHSARLDGHFTVDALEAIAVWMRSPSLVCDYVEMERA